MHTDTIDFFWYFSKHIYSVNVVSVQPIHPLSSLLSNFLYSVSKGIRGSSSCSREEKTVVSIFFRHRYFSICHCKAIEGQNNCKPQLVQVEAMEGWVHNLVYSTPAAAKCGIVQSWKNKEKAIEQTCEEGERLRSEKVDGKRERRGGISNVSKGEKKTWCK